MFDALTTSITRRLDGQRRWHWWPAVALLSAAVLAGCSSTPGRAPVEDRKPQPSQSTRATRPAAPGSVASGPASTTTAPTPPAAGATSPVDAARPPAGAENAGKPGYYTVKPGDTLIRIGLDNGQNWRDLVRWNAIENPDRIDVGQVLRVLPPTVDAGAVVSRGVAQGRVDARPIEARPPAPLAGGAPGAGTPPAGAGGAAPGAASGAAGLPGPPAVAGANAASGPANASANGPGTAPGTAPANAPAPPPSASAASAPGSPAPAREADEDLALSWPANGPVGGFVEEGRTRGLLITGQAGDPVLAAADGRVIYAGAALRGFGNLVIVKHNNTYLTAYAYNRTLLVKDTQVVRRGQKIAEMGATDTDRVQLRFEVRRMGKPVDPLQMLPPR